MQCAECGAEITSSDIYPNIYGFSFCDPTSVPIEQESCEDIFERKLWEAAKEQAKANKQAERKTESTTSEVSGGERKMVEGIASEWQTP